MTLTAQIVNLKQKGFSQKEIANKLNITQQAVSLHIVKATKEGLWNGKVGQTLTEQDLTLNGETPKIKGAYRCSKCSRPLTPIDEVIFNPSHLKQTLKQNDFTHICTDCKIAFSHVGNLSSEKSRNCPQCKQQLAELTIKGNPTNAYFCERCRQAYVFKEDEENETEVSSKQIEKAMQNIQD